MSETDSSTLMDTIRENVIGYHATYEGPFGKRRVIYCDFVASGKPIRFIEEYLTENVLPFYANTHTTTSISSLQTTVFRNEARDIIKCCVNATDEDVVIFTGSGATSAIHKLINAIQLRGEKAKNTVVLIGPFEHHSNILPWKVSGAEVIRLKENLHGELDLDDLKKHLQASKDAGKEIIAALSAASNVTGIKTDTNTVSDIVHSYGGLAFWDYACAGPYLEINMNPGKDSYKDAVFVSPHKFLGGPGTPGVLIAKKKLFTNYIPGGVGGGTVVMVTNKTIVYTKDIEEREEGGTPAIIESIRAGLAFQLKQDVGAYVIESIEDYLCARAFKGWRKNKNLQILGGHSANRLPIFSILICHPQSKKFLHHNFISVLLNDLFGIQARGGCACAGPYAMDLLSITEEMEQKLINALVAEEGEEGYRRALGILKPGFARLNFPFFQDEETVDYIIEAVNKVATHGWKLLPLYKCNPYTGTFQHRYHGIPKLCHLTDAKLEKGHLRATRSIGVHGEGDIDFKDAMSEADELFEDALQLCQEFELDEEALIPEEFNDLVWFLLPEVAMIYLKTPSVQYLAKASDKPPVMVRQNTLVRVRKRFLNAMEHLGYDTDKLRETTFYGGNDSVDGLKCMEECSSCE